MTLFGCIGDIHGRLDRLEQALRRLSGANPDYVLLTGDFTASSPFSGETPGDDDWLEPIRMVERYGFPLYFVPGNHDSPTIAHPANLDHRLVSIGEVRAAGIGGANSTFGFPYEWKEEDLTVPDPASIDLLLSHTPPVGLGLDRTKRGLEVGSRRIREIADRLRGAIVCGHVHEAAGVARTGDCLCLNVGSLGSPFGRCQVGFLGYHPATRTWTAEHEVLD